ncbi:hypothetical protein GDI3691 [Gluconacetobacter diazotrophicus PA1 5]|uniref:Uncharacterized protein n=1 Tax=Gluconacetobacter diazotrophicus (strain ATCC 49037 / DSM 5601 / CCUG 37298 / CIP 103539 / LMG 7603 / PAl5) TaxID=272568 RepID=A9H7F9_GLUDA|nr:hypothetical protein GDI3691 [Gluconacetobacter diazotrophicus PA1 5]
MLTATRPLRSGARRHTPGASLRSALAHQHASPGALRSDGRGLFHNYSKRWNSESLMDPTTVFRTLLAGCAGAVSGRCRGIVRGLRGGDAVAAGAGARGFGLWPAVCRPECRGAEFSQCHEHGPARPGVVHAARVGARGGRRAAPASAGAGAAAGGRDGAFGLYRRYGRRDDRYGRTECRCRGHRLRGAGDRIRPRAVEPPQCRPGGGGQRGADADQGDHRADQRRVRRHDRYPDREGLGVVPGVRIPDDPDHRRAGRVRLRARGGHLHPDRRADHSPDRGRRGSGAGQHGGGRRGEAGRGRCAGPAGGAVSGRRVGARKKGGACAAPPVPSIITWLKNKPCV